MTGNDNRLMLPALYRPREMREVLISFVVVVFSIAVTAHILPGPVREYAYSFILAGMVYMPVWRTIKYEKPDPLRAYAIHLEAWPKEILYALKWAAIIFPPYIIGYHIWHSIGAGQEFSFAWPEKFLGMTFIEQTLFIALPEEFFYRGWMLSVFEKRRPDSTRLMGAPFGKAVLYTSLLFALAHLAAVPSPFRLAVFFPSLLFCWMRLKRGSLISPILLHGLSNTLVALLAACYR
mgnify:FL=1